MNDLAPSNDTGTATIIYALYFVALFTGVPFFIGVIIAYISRGDSGPAARSHYDHQIEIFWTVFIGGILAGIAITVGIPLSFILIGIPLVIAGALALLYFFIWTLVRCIRGVQLSSTGRAYTGPRGFTI